MRVRGGTEWRRQWLAVSLALFLATCIAGCGAPAAPLPPTLNLPQPVTDLAAARVADTVRVTFSVPPKTTDKLPLRGAMSATLCRRLEAGPCEPVRTVTLPGQEKATSVEDALPPALLFGPPRLLTYQVSLLNGSGKSAGPSNPAYAVAGAAPPAVAGFAVKPERAGIVLSWQTVNAGATETDRLLFERTRTAGSGAPTPASPKGEPKLGVGKAETEPAVQILQVPEAGRPVGALDRTAHTGNSYRYTAARVEQVLLGSHSLDLSSAASTPVEVAYRDVFPPPVPAGLVSAADSASRSIDLSWTPDIDPDLAGYVVYRRTLGKKTTAERISPPAKPVITPNWSDATAVVGERYAYSVSAIDATGNESRRSAEVEDGLALPRSMPSPAPQPQR